MDIIAAHRQGLIEKLHEEAAALVGRPKDFAQRAVVLHHIYDHSRGNHEWALAEARCQMRMMSAIDRLRLRLKRWGWLTVRRAECATALELLAEALGKAARDRCHSAYVAYRLGGIGSLHAEAGELISPELLECLADCHAARRSGEVMQVEQRSLMFELSEQWAAPSEIGEGLLAAWGNMDATGLKRSAKRWLGQKQFRRSLASDRKRGWPKVERELRADLRMPASFRANPAQHFYALQNMLAERRRQRWGEACDQEPDAFELAA